MNALKRLLAVAVTLAAVTGCAPENEPGPLAGTWRVVGPQRMKMHFRRGEVEALGVVEQVAYERSGNDVIVTYRTGISAGKSVRFTMTGLDTARSELGALYRSR